MATCREKKYDITSIWRSTYQSCRTMEGRVGRRRRNWDKCTYLYWTGNQSRGNYKNRKQNSWTCCVTIRKLLTFVYMIIEENLWVGDSRLYFLLQSASKRNLWENAPIRGKWIENAVTWKDCNGRAERQPNAVSRALDYNSPSALVFHRDTLLNIPLEADLLPLRQKRKQLINMTLIRHNAKRWNFDSAVGQKVSVTRTNGRMMSSQTNGPFPIVQVFTYGPVAIQRKPNVVEKINIKQLSPYRWWSLKGRM